MRLILERPDFDTDSLILEEAVLNVRDYLKEAQNALLKATHSLTIVSELVARSSKDGKEWSES